MTKKIDELDQTPGDGEHTQLQGEIINKQIDLHDIMTLVEKLAPSGKTIFFHNLSQQKNLSENVFTLLLNQCDSQVVFNLCRQEDISGKPLDMLVQKLMGMYEGKEQVLLFNNNEEDSNDDEESNFENEKFLTSEYMNSFLSLVMENSNLTSHHIENLMKSFNGPIGYECMRNICSHPETPSWILEKMYEIDPKHMKNIVFSHPNISDEQRNEMMPSIDEIKVDIAKTIFRKHPQLDKHEVLKYYENKNDQETSQRLAEYLYNDNLGSYFYGNKWQYEDLKGKLKLAKKYNLGEECILRILYDMIGDNIARIGELELYERYDEKAVYLTIPEAEAKYGVTIGQEKIKDICCKVLEQMPRWSEPNMNIIENVYKIAHSLEIELSLDMQKYYIDGMIKNMAKKNTDGDMGVFESWHYLDKSLKGIIKHRDLFSQEELENYVMSVDKKIFFPLTNRYINDILNDITHKYQWTTNLLIDAKKDGFKDIKALAGTDDIFSIIEKLELDESFTHKIAIEKIKKFLKYDHADGKKIVQKFNISEEELINLIVYTTKNSSLIGYDTGETIRYFCTEGKGSLEECLQKYDIPSDKVVPLLMGEIKKQLVSCIKDKNYTRASIIIRKYNLVDDPELAECIDTVEVLTQ